MTNEIDLIKQGQVLLHDRVNLGDSAIGNYVLAVTGFLVSLQQPANNAELVERCNAYRNENPLSTPAAIHLIEECAAALSAATEVAKYGVDLADALNRVEELELELQRDVYQQPANHSALADELEDMTNYSSSVYPLLIKQICQALRQNFDVLQHLRDGGEVVDENGFIFEKLQGEYVTYKSGPATYEHLTLNQLIKRDWQAYTAPEPALEDGLYFVWADLIDVSKCNHGTPLWWISGYWKQFPLGENHTVQSWKETSERLDTLKLSQPWKIEQPKGES